MFSNNSLTFIVHGWYEILIYTLFQSITYIDEWVKWKTIIELWMIKFVCCLGFLRLYFVWNLQDTHIMNDLARMFIHCLNHWKLSSPTLFMRQYPHEDIEAYKLNFSRYSFLVTFNIGLIEFTWKHSIIATKIVFEA